ncbi:MAG TPA: hypothetical protein EYP57_08110 [Thermodesulfobacteriaceae bacterium]|nr:hypothetical protein [Thermodesulfobacteriaceae bacterium]
MTCPVNTDGPGGESRSGRPARHESSPPAVENLARHFCTISADITDAAISAAARQADVRERLLIGCLFILLRLTESFLASGHRENEMNTMMDLLIKSVTRNIYERLFSQDIIPDTTFEYFLDYFRTNYDLSLPQLVPCNPVRMDSADADPAEIFRDSIGWLAESCNCSLPESLIAFELWDSWNQEDTIRHLDEFDRTRV